MLLFEHKQHLQSYDAQNTMQREILGPIIHPAQGAAQVFLLVSARRSSHFPVLHRVV